jgi:hypothetical protein
MAIVLMRQVSASKATNKWLCCARFSGERKFRHAKVATRTSGGHRLLRDRHTIM